MRVCTDFRDRYQALETRMRAQAEADRDIFLPSAAPDGAVDYVLICMEPSLGRWAQVPDEAESKIKGGFRNFLSSLEDFIVHFCARRYLCCEVDERYHITDMAKGAMLVEHAGAARVERYDRWYGLLLEELALISRPNVRIVAVGNVVSDYLEARSSGAIQAVDATVCREVQVIGTVAGRVAGGVGLPSLCAYRGSSFKARQHLL